LPPVYNLGRRFMLTQYVISVMARVP